MSKGGLERTMIWHAASKRWAEAHPTNGYPCCGIDFGNDDDLVPWSVLCLRPMPQSDIFFTLRDLRINSLPCLLASDGHLQHVQPAGETINAVYGAVLVDVDVVDLDGAGL